MPMSRINQMYGDLCKEVSEFLLMQRATGMSVRDRDGFR